MRSAQGAIASIIAADNIDGVCAEWHDFGFAEALDHCVLGVADAQDGVGGPLRQLCQQAKHRAVTVGGEVAGLVETVDQQLDQLIGLHTPHPFGQVQRRRLRAPDLVQRSTGGGGAAQHGLYLCWRCHGGTIGQHTLQQLDVREGVGVVQVEHPRLFRWVKNNRRCVALVALVREHVAHLLVVVLDLGHQKLLILVQLDVLLAIDVVDPQCIGAAAVEQRLAVVGIGLCVWFPEALVADFARVADVLHQCLHAPALQAAGGYGQPAADDQVGHICQAAGKRDGFAFYRLIQALDHAVGQAPEHQQLGDTHHAGDATG